MGVDIMFKMRHNLDVSSVDKLVKGLQNKLGIVARGFFNPADIDILDDLGLPHPKYTTEGEYANIEVEDEYLVARSLIATYGDSAIAQIENNSEYQCYIDQINEVNQGLYSYRIHYVPICKLGVPHIWNVTNDAISGAPGFGNERWFQFSYTIGGISKIDNEYLLDLINSRRKLYDLLKPLMKGEYIYYHADQGEGEEISYINHFDDIPEYVTKLNFEIFDLSEYILNADSKQIYNSQETEYIIRDDFKDLL